MFHPLVHPFLAYRSFFFPFLALTAIVVPFWLAVRLYRLRAPGHRLSLPRELLLLTLVVYLSGLAAATLTPNQSSRVVADGTGGVELRPSLAALTCASASLPTGSVDRFCMRNAGGNVMLFFPLGMLIPLVRRNLRLRRGIAIAIGVSFGIELIQYLSSAWGSYRSADVNDVILNGVGACLGLALVSLLRLHPGIRRVVRRA